MSTTEIPVDNTLFVKPKIQLLCHLSKHIIVICFVSILTSCSLREINLSGYKSTSSGDVSYLLVDKTEVVGNVLVFVEAINDIELDLVKDPCVYIVKSGISKISYSTSNDFQLDGTYLRHTLTVAAVPGKYYQLLPYQNSGDDLKLTEIDKGKIKETYDKQPSLLAIIFFFKG